MKTPLLIHNKKPNNCACTCNITLGIFTAIVAVAIAVVVAIVVGVTANTNAYQRYLIGAPNGTVNGMMALQSSDRTIEWSLDYLTSIGPILSLHVMGPIPAGLTTAPLALSLCGTPSSLACDLSTAGHLSGIISQLDPGGGPLKPYINAIRAEPWKYYLQINTATYVLGELRAPLGILAGTP